jgi:hypothetical protein
MFIIVVYSVSLRQQLQDVGKKIVGAHHYNKDGILNNRQGFMISSLVIFQLWVTSVSFLKIVAWPKLWRVLFLCVMRTDFY